MAARNSEDPRIQTSCGIPAELYVAADLFAKANGFTRQVTDKDTGEKSTVGNIGGLLVQALADKIGYELTTAEKAATRQPLSDEERKAEQRKKDQARRAAAQARVAELRAKLTGQSVAQAPAQAPEAPAQVAARK